jgi:hypothetical protein
MSDEALTYEEEDTCLTADEARYRTKLTKKYSKENTFGRGWTRNFYLKRFGI